MAYIGCKQETTVIYYRRNHRTQIVMIKAVTILFFVCLAECVRCSYHKVEIKRKSIEFFQRMDQFIAECTGDWCFCVHFCFCLVMFKALSTANFTFVIPVSAGINFILTVIAGYYIFKDQLNMASFIGFALIISGIILLSLNNAQHASIKLKTVLSLLQAEPVSSVLM